MASSCSLQPLSLADVQAEIATYHASTVVSTLVLDTNGLVGVAGATVTAQAYLDALANTAFQFATVTTLSTAGLGQIVVNMPAGYTTANITGYTLTSTATGNDLAVTQAIDATSSMTYLLSAYPDVSGEHILVVGLAKLKF
jgi:hypothetical protein